MDFGVVVFILGMLAFGYMGNPFMAIAFAIMGIVFFAISKETSHKHMRMAGVLVGVAAAVFSVSLTFYANWLSVVAQQQQALQYEQLYEQMYGSGSADDGGYIVDPGADAGTEAVTESQFSE